MKKRAVKFLAYVLAAIGIIASGASSVGCMWLFFDEPEMPHTMLE
ncbi:MAG: hypothetical protein PHI22_01120 [Bacilli bacterium]|nr:hypothetical protein [Bacilli bacterium]MDD4298092.1 hypothetical protein [Bacilli bacterium]